MSDFKTARFIRGMVNTKLRIHILFRCFISMNSFVHNLLKLETIWSTYDFIFVFHLQNLPLVIHRMEIFMLFLHEEEILKTSRGEVPHDFSSFISRFILPSIVNIQILTTELLGEVPCCEHETIEFFRLRFTNRSCILSHIYSLQTYTHTIIRSC